MQYDDGDGLCLADAESARLVRERDATTKCPPPRSAHRNKAGRLTPLPVVKALSCGMAEIGWNHVADASSLCGAELFYFDWRMNYAEHYFTR